MVREGPAGLQVPVADGPPVPGDVRGQRRRAAAAVRAREPQPRAAGDRHRQLEHGAAVEVEALARTTAHRRRAAGRPQLDDRPLVAGNAWNGAGDVDDDLGPARPARADRGGDGRRRVDDEHVAGLQHGGQVGEAPVAQPPVAGGWPP